MKNIELIIPGVPKPQSRHRSVNHGKFTRTYDPSTYDKVNFLWKAIIDNKPATPLDVPLIMDIRFYMPRPKSHYKTGKNAGELKENAPEYHIKTPDIDNLEKFVQDALNKIYYRDDALIYRKSSVKRYSETPRTEIEIYWEL